MRTITLLLFSAAVISRGMTRSDARLAVAEATLGGVRAVIADFDGGESVVVSLSSELARAAAAASDGHDFLLTWIAGGALHAAPLGSEFLVLWQWDLFLSL